MFLLHNVNRVIRFPVKPTV